MLISIRYDVQGRLISASHVDQRQSPDLSQHHPTTDGATHIAWHGPETTYQVDDNRLAGRLLKLKDEPDTLGSLQRDWENYCREQAFPQFRFRPAGRKPGSKVVIPRAA